MREKKHSIILGKFKAKALEDLQNVAEELGMRVRSYSNEENHVLASRSLRDSPLPPALVEISRITSAIPNDEFEIVLRWIGEKPDEFSSIQEEVTILMNTRNDIDIKGQSFHQDKMPTIPGEVSLAPMPTIPVPEPKNSIDKMPRWN